MNIVLRVVAAVVLIAVAAGCASSPPAAKPVAAVVVSPEQIARDAERVGDYGAAARAWQELAGASQSPGREAYQLRAAAAWLAAGDATSSQALLGQVDVAPHGDALIGQKQILLARLALGRGDEPAAAAALAPTIYLALPAELATERDALLRELPAGVLGELSLMPLTAGNFLAVLLPYGGKLAQVADAITAGIVAARLEADSGPELRFYDTGNDAAAAYHQAVADGAAALIGPLEKADVAALATGPLPRPTVALNNPQSPVGQVNLYRLSLDPADEAAAGARVFAAAGYREVALLYVDDSWGRRQRDLYQTAVAQQGGRVTQAVSFDAGSTDFAGRLRGLLGERLAALQPPASGSLSPESGPGRQGLIVLASATDARQIVPQLGYIGAFGVPVLTSSRVWSGSSSQGTDADLEGVVFCDSPWALLRQTAGGRGDRLAAARVAWPQFDRDQPRLMALGADAYAVASQLLTGQSVDALPDGLTGALGLEADGALRRQVLTCARFHDGMPQLLTAGERP